MRKSIAAAAAAALLAIAGSTSAATLYSFDFTANTPGPTPFHSGSFSFSFEDPLLPTLLSIDFAIGGTTFTTANADIIFFFGNYLLGGTQSSPGGIIMGSDDFWLIFNPETSLASQFRYSQVGSEGGSGLVSMSPATSTGAIPEPATWAMLIAGFGGVGSLMRRRRQASAFA